MVFKNENIHLITEDMREPVFRYGQIDSVVTMRNRDYANRIDEAHCREVSVITAEHDVKIAAKDNEITSLRALVKELADALEYNECYRCTYNCTTCTCKDNKNALVAKAREAV